MKLVSRSIFPAALLVAFGLACSGDGGVTGPRTDEAIDVSTASANGRITPCAPVCAPGQQPTLPGPLNNPGGQSVSVSPATATVLEEETVKLSAAVSPIGLTPQLVWSSLNPAIATVDSSGTVTGVSAGTALITGSVTGASDTAVVTVTPSPRTVFILSGDGQTAIAGTAVSSSPTIIVRTKAGTPVAGVNIVFEVISGGGRITAGTATTGAQGTASAGSWMLGPVPGTNTLRATAANTVNGSVTFTATGSSTCLLNSYTLGSSVNGTWTQADCVAAGASGRHYDLYQFSISTQAAFRALITGPLGRRVSMRRSSTTGEYVQLMASETFMPSTSNPLQVRYVLAPGTYVFEVETPDAATLGDYTLATTFDATASCNPLVYVTLGVTIQDRLSSTDCNGIVAGKEDWFLLLPQIGQRVDLTLESAAIAPILVFRDDRLGPASPTLTSDFRFKVGETARTAYTTTFTGFHEIVVNNGTAALGDYTLTIGSGNPSNTCVASPTTIGGRKRSYWEATDCQADGRLYDRYPFTLSTQSAVRLTLASAATYKSAGIFAGSAEVLDYVRGREGDLAATWYLAPNSYEYRTGAPGAAAGTPYTVTSDVGSSDLGCRNNASSGNFTFASQSLVTGDCGFNSRFEDRVVVLVDAGKEIVLTMDGSVAPAVYIRAVGAPAGTILTGATRATPGSVTAVWRAATTGYFELIFSTNAQNVSGTYSGSIVVR